MKRDKPADDDLFRNSIADFERRIIVSTLEQTGGNQKKAAIQLGTTKRMLAYRVQKYGIDLGRFRRKGDGNNDKNRE
jgi:Nif-specific regulatory protein